MPSAARSGSRDLALVAVFAGIVAALGVVPALYPLGSGVPVTAQSMGVMLAGGVLGARRGGLCLLLFVALVAVGLPLLAGGRGGLGAFVGPSAGFLVGFPVAAWAVGWLSARVGSSYTLSTGVVANLVGGVAVLYAFGIPGIAWFTDAGVGAAAVVALAFLPGDLVKAVLAAVVTRGVHRATPGLLAHRQRDATPV